MALIVDTLPVDHSQLELWRDGSLGKKWARRFKDELPLYFDEDFPRYYKNQGMRHPGFEGGYGFYDTLAAIVLYQATGYRALAPTHNFEFRAALEEVVEKLLSADVIGVIKDRERFGGTQAPDLLMYSPDLSHPSPDWFFCDAKGPNDRLGRKQRAKFEAIARVSGKPVRILRFKSRRP